MLLYYTIFLFLCQHKIKLKNKTSPDWGWSSRFLSICNCSWDFPSLPLVIEDEMDPLPLLVHFEALSFEVFSNSDVASTVQECASHARLHQAVTQSLFLGQSRDVPVKCTYQPCLFMSVCFGDVIEPRSQCHLENLPSKNFFLVPMTSSKKVALLIISCFLVFVYLFPNFTLTVYSLPSSINFYFYYISRLFLINIVS